MANVEQLEEELRRGYLSELPGLLEKAQGILALGDKSGINLLKNDAGARGLELFNDGHRSFVVSSSNPGEIGEVHFSKFGPCSNEHYPPEDLVKDLSKAYIVYHGLERRIKEYEEIVSAVVSENRVQQSK